MRTPSLCRSLCSLAITLPLFFFVLSTAAQQGLQPQLQQVLDTTLYLMQKNAANSSRVNWSLAKQEAYKRAAKAQTPAELGSSIRYLYQQLGDYHRVFFFKDSAFRWTKIRTRPQSLRTLR